MIREMIQLAEDLYARGHNPTHNPIEAGEELKDFAVRLGHLIEECGMTLRRYQERVEQQAFYIKRLENQIKEMRDDSEA